MKKIFTLLALAITMSSAAVADEGMWLLPLLEKLNTQALRDLGCRVSPEDIYSVNHSSLKDAIVIFGGGCTAEVISKNGLLVTNHHCGYSTIQRLSSVENNYLENGFWARNRKEEIPCPGLKVTFLVSMTDVTDVIEGIQDEQEKKTRMEQIIKTAEGENPGCVVEIEDFYNTNVWYLIVYKVYKDVRLVGTPPVSAGKFGGETDNWIWPRHTCDFSMFRIYADKDGNPAEYSKSNKPLNAETSLSISLKGMQEGDFTMIMGYPGRTQRYMTAQELECMEEVHDVSVAARTVRQDIMWKAMRSDEKIGLQYANKYASSANAWKKWQGQRKCFEDLNIIEREKEKEKALQGWALNTLDSCAVATHGATLDLTLLRETLLAIEPFGIASRYLSAMRNSDKDAGKAKQAALSSLKDYNEELEREIAAAMIKHYLENVRPGSRIDMKPKDFDTFPTIEEYVEWLFDNSVFSSEEKVKALGNDFDASTDPAVQALNCVIDKYRDFSSQANALNGKRIPAAKEYTAQIVGSQGGKPVYPDANFTMRLTYGSVQSYSPKDGVLYKYYTTLDGVMEKEDPSNYEFIVPEKIKEIWKNQDFGEYADKDGKLHTCFLTNNDITGGNSGSPVLDADGNLIGLAFDGNWESMSSDVIFEPELQRCICVDIRYVLLYMDKFGGAGYLLKEMNIVK